MLYIDDQSDAFDLDEGFFVLLIMLVPAAMTVLVFAVVAVVAQAVKRRPLVKSVFNVGQVVTSAGIGALAFVLVHGPDHSDGYVKVGAALVGPLLPGGEHRGHRLHPGLSRHPLEGDRLRRHRGQAPRGGRCHRHRHPDGAAAGLPAEVPPLAVLPLFVLRYLGEGHFYARNDRMRLRGLFEATLDVNRSIGSDQTRAAVLSSPARCCARPRSRSILNDPNPRTAPCLHRSSWPTAGCGCPSPAAAVPSPSTTLTLHCSMPWRRSGNCPGQRRPLRGGRAAKGQPVGHHQQPR